MKHLITLLFVLLSLTATAQQKQLRISVLGDSYSTFQGYMSTDTNFVWYFPDGHKYKNPRNDVSKVEQTWWHQAIAKLNGKLEKNNSFSGATICKSGYKKDAAKAGHVPVKGLEEHADFSNRAFINRTNALGNPDVILVCGGTNDSWAGSPIGDYVYNNWTSEQLFYFRPAMAKMLADLQANHPKARILFILNSELSQDINESVHTICEHYGVKCLDLQNIEKQGGHPSQKGMKAFADQVVKALSSTERKFVLKNSADGKSELTVYLPTAEAAAKANGRAVVGCPGGGYSHLSMDNEGHQWADYYNSQGIAYAVLKYRMPNGNRNIPLTDAYNAIRTMRDSAAVWHVNPRNVGIMGFSAGGHLASAVSTHAPYEVRPNFSILFYPVISMAEKETHKGSVVGFLGDARSDANLVKEWSSNRAVRRHLTPPAIILLANDDRAVPPVTNGVAYYSAMRNQSNTCEMHIYPSGGHGFGMKTAYKYHDRMLGDLTQWLSDLRMPAEKDIKVACIGNSITDGHGIDMAPERGYPALLQRKLGKGYEVKNFGLSSRTLCNGGNVPYMKELAWRDAKAYCPDIVIIKLGTNDTKPENLAVTKATFQKDYQQMIDTLKALPSHPRIIISTPIPAFKSTWGITESVITDFEIPVIQKLAKKNKLQLIDFHTLFANDSDKVLNDGIHPNDKGVAKMADIVYEAIKEK